MSGVCTEFPLKLKTVALHITRVCENRCPFCYLGDEGRHSHPPREQVKKTVREMARQGIEEIYFVGGDPCSYPYLLDMAALSKSLGMKNTLLSNTLQFGGRVGEAVAFIDCFETTLLGHTNKEHDTVAGREGACSNLLRNMRALNAKGKDVGIVINATPNTFDKMFLLVENLLHEEIQISYVMVQRIIPQGRAANNLEYGLSAPQVAVLFQELEKINQVYNTPIVFEDPFPWCIVESKYHRFLSRCEWGFTRGSLDAGGNLSRCGSDPRYSIGNIFVTDLQALWNTSPILVSFRSYKWLPERCQNCELLTDCGGGCSLSRVTEKDHDVDILYHFQTNDKRDGSLGRVDT